MKHLDITIDFETCGLCPTAAPISLGAVAWNRYEPTNPFLADKRDDIADFYEHIDLRYAFLDGFFFDPLTSLWWSQQSDEAKKELLADNPYGMPLVSVKDCIINLFAWINDVRERVGAKTVCLWSQGSDFDIAILRNICHKYQIAIPVNYQYFRDHRSVSLEMGDIILTPLDTLSPDDITVTPPSDVYALVEKYSGEGSAHNPIFDCRKSAHTTWQLMKQSRHNS